MTSDDKILLGLAVAAGVAYYLVTNVQPPDCGAVEAAGTTISDLPVPLPANATIPTV